MEGFESDSNQVTADLKEFVQVLDYIAARHFGLYGRLSEGKEDRKMVSDLAVEIYPQIEQTTGAALAFYENYNLKNDTRELKDF